MTDEEFATLKTNGIKVNYSDVCARKLWLYSRDIRWSGLITAVNPEVGCD